MADEKERTGLRRFGRRDRKERLTSEPLFPEDDSPLPADEALMADTSSIFGTELAEELPESERFPPVRPPPTEDDSPKRARSRAVQPYRRVRRRHSWLYNLIAFLFFVATLALCGVYAMIWNDPWTALNPLAPATEFFYVTETPDPLAVINGTATAAALATETPLAPLESLGGLPFSIVELGVLYAPNSNTSGCDWASIAGTVQGLNGEPLPGYRIGIIDAENPERLDVEVFSGAVQSFGEGGFEYTLGNAPRAGRYDIQLLSRDSVPLSDVYRITTRATCEENVAIINFVQTAQF